MKVLLVDDEEAVLSSLKRLITLEFPEIETHLAKTGEEAITLIEYEEFSLIISDFNMAGVSGSKVLAHANKKQPDAFRVLLTGDDSDPRITEAKENWNIEYVLKKPWSDEDIIRVLRHV